jgi:serine protease Do
MKRIAFAFLVFLISVFGISSSVNAETLVQTVARVKASVVGIAIFQPSNFASAQVIGSGFAVGDGLHVVTSYHVVKPVDGKVGRSLYVLSLSGGQTDRRTAKIIATDPASDIAILEIEGPSLAPLKLREDAAMVPEGTEIAITGFPIELVLGFQPTTARGIVSALPSNRTPEVSVNGLDAATIRAPRFMIYQLDLLAYPGNSGGPVYETDTGIVIGVVAAGFIKSVKEHILSNPSAITYAVPSGFVRNLMIRAKLKETAISDK